MILEHYAAEPVKLEQRVYDQTLHHKPRGFWVSVKGEDDWPSWLASEQWHEERYVVRHEVRLAKTANILHLSTVAQIKEFHAKYTKRIIPTAAIEYIDWDRVVKDYDGIIIAPYQWSLRLDPDTHWYYTWDVASGCIWNTSAIERVALP